MSIKPGDRVVYKHNTLRDGSPQNDGKTGTVKDIHPSGLVNGDYAEVDWDAPGPRGLMPFLHNLQPLPAEVTPITTEYEADSHHDVVAHPSHYADGRKYEPKDVIRDWGLNFNRGSAVKYISRAGRKADELEDLRKARQFLDFEIEALEAEAR